MELVSHCMGVGTREILLMPIGDIQWAGDESEVALGMLKRHIRWGVERGAYFIGMGDYIDTFSPSNRARLVGAQLYDTAVKAMDRDAETRVREIFAEALKPSKGRWLGLLEGHHFHQFRNGMTSDQLLADMLDAKFLGTSAYVRMTFRASRSQNPKSGSVVIWCHHGAGSSSTAGGSLNRVAKAAEAWDADIYLMGHHHKKNGVSLDYVRPVYPHSGTPHLSYKTKLLVVTGSFLKGYIEGRRDGLVPRGGYVEQKMLNPVQLGGVLVKVRPRWDRAGIQAWAPDLNVEL